MPGFHHSVAVLPLWRSVVPLPFFRSVATVAIARENGIGGNVFPLTMFEQWPERWLAVQLWKNGKNRIRSYLLRNGGYGATAAGTATAQRNFSCKQRNSYGAYGIFVMATAKRQWNGGNQALVWCIVKCDPCILLKRYATDAGAQNNALIKSVVFKCCLLVSELASEQFVDSVQYSNLVITASRFAHIWTHFCQHIQIFL